MSHCALKPINNVGCRDETKCVANFDRIYSCKFTKQRAILLPIYRV